MAADGFCNTTPFNAMPMGPSGVSSGTAAATLDPARSGMTLFVFWAHTELGLPELGNGPVTWKGTPDAVRFRTKGVAHDSVVYVVVDGTQPPVGSDDGIADGIADGWPETGRVRSADGNAV